MLLLVKMATPVADVNTVFSYIIAVDDWFTLLYYDWLTEFTLYFTVLTVTF